MTILIMIMITAIKDCQKNQKVLFIFTGLSRVFIFFFPFMNVVNLFNAGETRVTTPTVTETQLPWKRDDEDDAEGGVQQHEFPAWASNKEYLAYNSPSATFLGNLLLLLLH